MTALRLSAVVVALAITSSVSVAQQGTGPTTPPGKGAAQSTRPANPGKGPLSNVSKSLPRRKDALQTQRDTLLARARASARRAQPAATKTGK